MESSYEDLKVALGGKDPEEVLQLLLNYIKRIKPKKIIATTVSEEDSNWDRLETSEDQKL